MTPTFKTYPRKRPRREAQKSLRKQSRKEPHRRRGVTWPVGPHAGVRTGSFCGRRNKRLALDSGRAIRRGVFGRRVARSNPHENEHSRIQQQEQLPSARGTAVSGTRRRRSVRRSQGTAVPHRRDATHPDRPGRDGSLRVSVVSSRPSDLGGVSRVTQKAFFSRDDREREQRQTNQEGEISTLKRCAGCAVSRGAVLLLTASLSLLLFVTRLLQRDQGTEGSVTISLQSHRAASSRGWSA